MTPPVKLYKEGGKLIGKPGPRTSTLNTALGAALLCSPIGAQVFREIFLSIGVDPGSEKGLNNLISKASQTIIQLAEESMTSAKQYLKKEHKEIHIAVDGRYNNRIFSSGATPFQAATQAVFTTVELMTPEKKIIHIELGNKLCSKRHKAHETCDEKCTANMELQDPIGNEGLYSMKTAAQLKKENLNIASVTSDGDSKIIQGFFKSMNKKLTTKMQDISR